MTISPSRRTFLQALAAGAVAAVPFAAQRESVLAKEGDSGPSGVEFGFSLYGLRDAKLSKALRLCASTGYDCVELIALTGWQCDPPQLSSTARDDLRKQLNDLNLTAAAIMDDMNSVVDARKHRKNLNRLKELAELGHTVSPKKAPVIETVLGGQPAQWDQLKQSMVNSLRDWAKVGESNKTIIAAKAHIAGALHTPADAKWLVTEVGSPWLKLVYDYSHFQLGGFALDDSLRMLIDDTAFIHVKDATGTKDKYLFQLPGEGKIDYSRYFALLKETKYAGAVMVEVSGQIHTQATYDPVTAAQNCYGKLAPLLAAAGIRRSKKA